jgi:hypothetical protein
MTINTFLASLVTSGGVGAAVALLLQYAPYLGGWFTGLGYEAKRLALLTLCFGIPLAATGAQIGLGLAAPSWNALFLAAYTGGLSYATSQAVHLGIRRVETARGLIK